MTTSADFCAEGLDALIEAVGSHNVYKKDSGFYEREVVQYATTSHKRSRTLPGLIIKPGNRQEIGAVLDYARLNKIGVAIRTGGHSYSGDSSCTAPNIQMDLSQTFKGRDDRTLMRSLRILRTSVSWSLAEFASYCNKNKIFVPHGQCIAVHLGGHVQTGGYGQLGRSFGLMADHVLELDIVDHTGKSRTITKQSDRDLFWAILGGSPGNYAVVTHFTLKVLLDEDYEGSTGMKCAFLYTPQKFKELLDVVVKMSDGVDPDGKPSPLAQNYDVCLNVLSSKNTYAALFPETPHELKKHLHPPGEAVTETSPPATSRAPRLIVVWVQWVQLKKTDVLDRKLWFDRLSNGCIDGYSLNYKELKPTPMSYMTSNWWILDNVREYPWPYIKSTRMSDKTDLRKTNWANWIGGLLEQVLKPEEDELFIVAQIQPFGGPNSQTVKNKGNGTSYSFRDATMIVTLDCFYKHHVRDRALKWFKDNESKVLDPKYGDFSTKDMRPLWGSFGEYDFSKIWHAYHEDQHKYDKLRKLRDLHDPDGVFTPNTFSVPHTDAGAEKIARAKEELTSQRAMASRERFSTLHTD
ncbi:FAD binding domain-containing protein [Rutstroemia sp. NJR-2017a BBW]|nr:FAD binding domain-containing protein [Rutstroemia sp. NJR-2017a BBW]